MIIYRTIFSRLKISREANGLSINLSIAKSFAREAKTNGRTHGLGVFLRDYRRKSQREIFPRLLFDIDVQETRKQICLRRKKKIRAGLSKLRCPREETQKKIEITKGGPKNGNGDLGFDRCGVMTPPSDCQVWAYDNISVNRRHLCLLMFGSSA